MNRGTTVLAPREQQDALVQSHAKQTHPLTPTRYCSSCSIVQTMSLATSLSVAFDALQTRTDSLRCSSDCGTTPPHSDGGLAQDPRGRSPSLRRTSAGSLPILNLVTMQTKSEDPPKSCVEGDRGQKRGHLEDNDSRCGEPAAVAGRPSAQSSMQEEKSKELGAPFGTSCGCHPKRRPSPKRGGPPLPAQGGLPGDEGGKSHPFSKGGQGAGGQGGEGGVV